ncbi:MAG: hypothetical protein RLZZ450_2948 [Pseudomonadota bacterium]|jgi:uncharacterized membrane protein YedE/YeeE
MNIEWARALLGGVLIGSACALLLMTHGRIAGISNVMGGLLQPRQVGDTSWRVGFLGALVLGGALFVRIWPERFSTLGMPRWPVLIIAGLLVGVGTRLGNGCTSGHGVCGMGRGSPRSLAATLTFMVAGILAVLVTRHAL